MFITNIRDIKNKNLFICDKRYSDFLISNGFCLLGFDKEDYFYYMTNKLKKFLKQNGGEKK